MRHRFGTKEYRAEKPNNHVCSSCKQTIDQTHVPEFEEMATTASVAVATVTATYVQQACANSKAKEKEKAKTNLTRETSYDDTG